MARLDTARCGAEGRMVLAGDYSLDWAEIVTVMVTGQQDTTRARQEWQTCVQNPPPDNCVVHLKCKEKLPSDPRDICPMDWGHNPRVLQPLPLLCTLYVFRLVCEAQGEPAPDVFWTRENRDKIVVTDKKSGRRSTGQCGQGMLTIGATMDDIDI